MTIEIPAWLLWTLGLLVGVPALVALIALAWFGYVALTAVGKGIWR
ncbi:hypothetical protein ACQKOE_13700 [Novosphingobium sp. NPDC080210]